tara:strand:- start:1316 stop:1762 length:447 start_codon:yes stop_codon:yes gene_type:complete
MKSLFNQLFDYNFYCNKKLIDQFNMSEVNPTEKHVKLFSHVLNAHHIWNARLLGTSEKFSVFQIHSLSDFGDIHYENQRSSFEIVTNTDDFDKRINYQNSEGRQFSNTIQDILFHIINHSTHHRGQIAMESRANGIEPLSLDYIHYKR